MIVLCPRCGDMAVVIDPHASIGLEHTRFEVVYGCENCTTPGYDCFSDSVSYKQFTFLENGEEVF